MGRTLHYKALHHFKPIENQEQQIINLSREYNNKFEWTCENIFLSTYHWFPNWNISSKNENSWDRINADYEKLLQKGMTDRQVVRQLGQKGLIEIHEKDELSGFTKTSGNELNAHTVIMFVIEVSILCPDAVFSLCDEGDALYNDILVQDGKAKPCIESIQSTLKYWDKNWDSLKTYHNCANKRKYLEKILTQKHKFGNIRKYIRPLNIDGYCAKRETFKTKELDSTDLNVNNFMQFIQGFHKKEREESAQYYTDIQYFPEVK